MARLYLGNLPYSVDEAALRTFFAGFEISNVKIVSDKVTGKAKGFGFVDIAGDPQAAIDALDDQQLGGRRIRVNEAIDKPRGASNVGKGRQRGHHVGGGTGTNGPGDDDHGWR